ncbi:MAG: 2-isopropylmalate synthase, partial [Pseudomonadota bacterium]
HGEGTARYRSGDVYVGRFQEGQRHGPGRMTYADGAVVEAFWVNGRPGTAPEAGAEATSAEEAETPEAGAQDG